MKCVKKYLLNVKHLFYALRKLYAILENIMQHTAQAMKSIYAELTKGGQKLNRKITKEQVADAVAASVSHLPGVDAAQVRKLFLALTGTTANDESDQHDQ